MDAMMAVLELFSHRIARQILGMIARKGDGMEYYCASMDVALEATGLWPIGDYVRKRRATIV